MLRVKAAVILRSLCLYFGKEGSVSYRCDDAGVFRQLPFSVVALAVTDTFPDPPVATVSLPAERDAFATSDPTSQQKHDVDCLVTACEFPEMLYRRDFLPAHPLCFTHALPPRQLLAVLQQTLVVRQLHA